MGIHKQRKAFEHKELAEAAAAGFADPAFAIPGVSVSTDIVEDSGVYWLVLTQQGAVVTGAEPLLPDWSPM